MRRNLRRSTDSPDDLVVLNAFSDAVRWCVFGCDQNLCIRKCIGTIAAYSNKLFHFRGRQLTKLGFDILYFALQRSARRRPNQAQEYNGFSLTESDLRQPCYERT